MKRVRAIALTLLLLVAALAPLGLSPRPLEHTLATPEIGDVDAWAEARVARSRALGVRQGDEERLVRRTSGRSPVSVLYVHGFGASRAEGEAVVDPMAEALGANTLYLRLPGHGLDDPDAHAAPDFGDYLDEVEEGFQAARLLGDRVLVVGTSLGGLLSTWLAARHPDEVAGLILASPFFAFRDPMAAVLLHRPIAPPLIRALYGEDRSAAWTEDPEHRKQEGYERHWTIDQRYAAVFDLAALRRYIAKKETFEAVRAPVLLFYYYRDAEHQDEAASVAAMTAAFEDMGGKGGRHEQSRLVQVADGSHVLFSAYVRTDKALIQSEIQGFLAGTGLAP